MQLQWKELEWPIRGSVVMSLLAITTLEMAFLFVASEGPISDSDPISGLILLVAPIATGILVAGVLFLLFRNMSQENRGIVAFLLFTSSLLPILSLGTFAFDFGARLFWTFFSTLLLALLWIFGIQFPPHS